MSKEKEKTTKQTDK